MTIVLIRTRGPRSRTRQALDTLIKKLRDIVKRKRQTQDVVPYTLLTFRSGTEVSFWGGKYKS
jgi:hypothetical protein